MRSIANTLRLLLLLSILGSMVFLIMNNIDLISIVGVVCWVALSFFSWVVLSLILSPILILVGVVGAIRRI